MILEVEFIKPKNKNAEKVDWLISDQVREIIKNYAEYCEYTESEVVDMFLKNLLKCVFKKEDKKGQEVQGSAALSTGAYAVNT